MRYRKSCSGFYLLDYALCNLRYFGIVVLNRHSEFTFNSIHELLCYGVAVINRLCPRLSRLVSSTDLHVTYG